MSGSGKTGPSRPSPQSAVRDPFLPFGAGGVKALFHWEAGNVLEPACLWSKSEVLPIVARVVFRANAEF
jgi:hypothetical protein